MAAHYRKRISQKNPKLLHPSQFRSPLRYAVKKKSLILSEDNYSNELLAVRLAGSRLQPPTPHDYTAVAREAKTGSACGTPALTTSGNQE